MIKFWLFYFFLSDFYCYYKVSKYQNYEEMYNKKSPEKQRQLDELERTLRINFNLTIKEVIPYLQIVGLLFGWFLVPYSIVDTILEKLNIKL